MMGSMAIDACVSQYASACCRASSREKLSASNWMKPVSPTRSTSGLTVSAIATIASARTILKIILEF